MPRSNAFSGEAGTSLAEMDSRIASNLDKFFSDDSNWKVVANEVVATTASLRFPSMDSINPDLTLEHGRFRVQVPKGYPGVQYRKSKNLEERYDCYAKQGSIVVGHVEDHGEWLRIKDQVFLPMKVGTVRILEALPPEQPFEPEGAVKPRSDSWWSCGPSPQGQAAPVSSPDSEVVVADGIRGSLPWSGTTTDSALQVRRGSDHHPPTSELAVGRSKSMPLGLILNDRPSCVDDEHPFDPDSFNPFSDGPLRVPTYHEPPDWRLLGGAATGAAGRI